VNAANPPIAPEGGHRVADRLASAFLLALMAAGCLVMWIGIPVGAMWSSAKLTDNPGTHFVIALPVTVAAMVVFARGLFWLNRLYLRVQAARDPRDEDDDEEEQRFARGPLEPILIAGFVIAIVALFVWFFAYAHNPSQQVI
jgi:hypothetical protein